MNELIRELAEQALFESDFDDEQNIKITMDIFAKLIARRCAEICYNRDYTDGSRYGDDICEHFGVEE